MLIGCGSAHCFFNSSSAWDRIADRYACGSSSFAAIGFPVGGFDDRQPALAVRLLVDDLRAEIKVRVDLDHRSADGRKEAHVRLDRLKLGELVPGRELRADRLHVGEGHVAVELLEVVGQSDAHSSIPLGLHPECPDAIGMVKAVGGYPENELVNSCFKILWHIVSSTRVHVDGCIAEPQCSFEHCLRQCRMGVGRPRQIVGRGSHLHGQCRLRDQDRWRVAPSGVRRGFVRCRPRRRASPIHRILPRMRARGLAENANCETFTSAPSLRAWASVSPTLATSGLVKMTLGTER